MLEWESLQEIEIEHPQDQTRGEPLFLIIYINIFNSRGQFPSYLILYSSIPIKKNTNM